MGLVKFAWRDCLRNLSFSLFFIANISIGSAGFLLVSGMRSAIDRSLANNSQSMAGGDLTISSRRELTKIEVDLIEKLQNSGEIKRSDSAEFLSMVRGKEKSNLIVVRAVDAQFPLVPGIKLFAQNLAPQGAAKKLAENNYAWVSKDTAEILGLQIGDSFRLGELDFKVLDFLLEDPSQNFRSLSVGGKIYISKDKLAATELVRPGSTVSYSYSLLLNSPAINANDLATRLSAGISAPEVRIRTAKESAEDSTRALAYLGDFLGIVCLINLLVACIAAIFLIRSFVDARKEQFALLKCLGMSAKSIKGLLLSEVWILCGIALAPAILVAGAISPLLFQSLQSWSQIELSGGIALENIAFLGATLFIGAPLLLLPEIRSLDQIRPLSLLRNEEIPPARFTFLLLAPAMVLFFFLSSLVTHSYRNSTILFFSLIGVWLITWLILFLVRRSLVLIKLKDWTSEHSKLLFIRKSRSSFSFLSAIALSSLLLNALPLLETNVSRELEAPKGNSLPRWCVPGC